MSRVKFYGVRGSIPVCGTNFHKFGGNTTNVLLEGPNRTVIIDAGTGIRELGKEIAKNPRLGTERECFLIFSHFHWDHIQGLPFFIPAYDPKRKFTISAIGKEQAEKNIKSIFETQMREEYFPVPLEGMGAKIDFLHVESNIIFDDKSSLRVLKHNHPGGAYSYRFDNSDGKSIVFCTDIEHGKEIDQNIVDLAKNADLLIHEGQYTPEEYPKYVGWGHSTWEQAIQVAEQANVKRLVITHHDPDHDDDFLAEIEKQAQARFPNCCLAREKMEIDL
jgi:phosphoribosyl 1,2-cyclic phosphodiesterase